MTTRDAGREGWIGVFLAPAVFFAHLQVAYVLVPLSCATGSQLWLNVADGIAVIGAAIGAVVARRAWRAEEVRVTEGGEERQPGPRFLGIVGCVTSSTFVLLLLAQWSASLLISPCQ